MTAGQLGLFDPPAPPEFALHAVCHLCDPPALLAVIPVEGGAGAPWRAASLWAYLADAEHKRAAHPDRAAP